VPAGKLRSRADLEKREEDAEGRAFLQRNPDCCCIGVEYLKALFQLERSPFQAYSD
jgi:hypothetical protein